MLTRINDKQPDMLQRLLGSGLDVAASFHMRLQQGTKDALGWHIAGLPALTCMLSE